MQDDPFPAAERILSDIETVFKKDPELREFDIIPVTLNQNKSPVHHVEHCLGLESWCVRHVYCYTYHHLMDARQQRHRRTESSSLSRMLLGALLLNPDVQTFWNMRRELVQAGRLDICSELHFTAVVLSRKPKSSEAFAHRKWLLGRLLSTNPATGAILDEELRVTQYAADHYANNYHAWHHRMWCLTQLTSATSRPIESYLSEWTMSEAWISMHVSDHSGLQYRQFLLKHLCRLVMIPANKSSAVSVLESAFKSLHQYLHSGNKQETLFKLGTKDYRMYIDQIANSSVVISLNLIICELMLNSDLILRYTGHEALWCHRRFSLMLLKTMLNDIGDGSWHIDSSKTTVGEKNELEKSKCREKINNDCKLPSLCSKTAWTIEVQKNSSSNHPEENFIGYKMDQGEDCANSGIFGTRDFRNIDWIPLLKDQKLTEEEDEICSIVWKSVPWHEIDLLSKCREHDQNQQRLAIQHHRWLGNILGLQIHNPYVLKNSQLVTQFGVGT